MGAGKLYLVGTPIGNLKDITLRAIETLKSVDMIACEDTRHSLPLLKHYEINKPTFSCHMYNETQSAEKIVGLLNEGKNIALITDAGMPCISDPGAIVVAKTREAGLDIEVVPGASAVVSAMALSGITRRGFCFLGFLPDKKSRNVLLEPYKSLDMQLVFYSAPHDINADLDFLYKTFGDRQVYVVKEITKIHERVEIGVLGEFEIENPRGEYVIIIEGRETEKVIPDDVIEHYRMNFDKLGDKKEAIKLTARERGTAKDIVYKAVMLGEGKDDGKS